MSEIKTVKPRVSDVDFVKAYVAAKSTEECAAACGLTAASVSSRAAKLKAKGVKLPKYARAVKATDVAALNALLS